MNRRLVIIAVAACTIFATGAYAQWVACAGGSVTCTSQNTGIGTTSPLGALEVQRNNNDTYISSHAAAGYARLFVANDTGVGAIFYSYGSAFPGNFSASIPYANLDLLLGYGSAFVLGTNSAVPFVFATGPGPVERVRITASGSVGIGTSTPTALLDVAGSINVSGNIAAKYQDVAEWVASSDDIQPGTVVVLDPERSNSVRESRHAYDPTVAGVVSARPGLTLGEAGAGKEMVATTGRVRVHCDATAAPIRIGDLLVTGSKPGTAIRSTPVLIEGQPFHRPGTIMGKALEPLAKGEGDILVLLTLQ